MSSKITLGEGMTSMGDIRPTADCLDVYGGQLDACVVSRDDPRTTMRYDRGRQSLDRHATYIVATFVTGASR